MNLVKILDDMWTTGLLFYRPDPLGFYVIINDMNRYQKYLQLTVEERQIMKGYI